MIPERESEQQESLSLTDAIREQADNPEHDFDDLPEVPKVPAEATPWEAPAWTQRWKPEARDALGRFASNPELKSYYDPLKSQLEEINKYTTQRDQEYADYRRRLDPVYQVLQPFEQRYALQGVPIHQGVQQLFQAAELLNTDPDTAFPWLAGAYRPRNPVEAINQLANAWGIDLNQALQDAPYVDPTVTALLSPLQQQVQQMQQAMYQQQQYAQQQQQNALVSEVSDFEAAKDENGNLLHPHFGEVLEDMVSLVQMGRAKDLAGAYQLATQYSPKLQQSQQATLAEKARQKAIQEATARTAAAEKSEKASRTVAGKSRGDNARLHVSLKEAYEKAAQELGE